MNDEEQLIGEDWSTPVEVTPGMDQSTPLVLSLIHISEPTRPY